jgi:hypothetical protein
MQENYKRVYAKIRTFLFEQLIRADELSAHTSSLVRARSSSLSKITKDREITRIQSCKDLCRSFSLYLSMDPFLFLGAKMLFG